MGTPLASATVAKAPAGDRRGKDVEQQAVRLLLLDFDRFRLVGDDDVLVEHTASRLLKEAHGKDAGDDRRGEDEGVDE